MSVLPYDVDTVLGLQAVVKLMLDDVIGGQHAQAQQLLSILGSSVLTLNKSMESSLTTPSTTSLVEELQRNSTHSTTSPSSKNSHTSS